MSLTTCDVYHSLKILNVGNLYIQTVIINIIAKILTTDSSTITSNRIRYSTCVCTNVTSTKITNSIISTEYCNSISIIHCSYTSGMC